MSWTLQNMQELIDKMRHDRERDNLEWNKKFPPDAEVDVNICIITGEEGLTRYGIWEVEEGVFIIPKSKNGYEPERRITIPNEVVEK